MLIKTQNTQGKVVYVNPDNISLIRPADSGSGSEIYTNACTSDSTGHQKPITISSKDSPATLAKKIGGLAADDAVSISPATTTETKEQ